MERAERKARDASHAHGQRASREISGAAPLPRVQVLVYTSIMHPHHRAAQAMAADCLCFRARRAARAITRIYDDVLRPLGVQATQLTLLNAIAMSGESGAIMGRLAEVLALDATTLSRNLRPLVAMKLVRIGRHPDDGRMRVARLTSAGERVVAEALPLWTDGHRRVVSMLGGETAAELRDVLDTAVAAATAGNRR